MVQVAENQLFAPFVLNEKLDKVFDITASVIIIAGAVITTIFGPQETDTVCEVRIHEWAGTSAWRARPPTARLKRGPLWNGVNALLTDYVHLSQSIIFCLGPLHTLCIDGAE
jgi:hypothetical protein